MVLEAVGQPLVMGPQPGHFVDHLGTAAVVGVADAERAVAVGGTAVAVGKVVPVADVEMSVLEDRD